MAKYNNRPVIYDGIRFPSETECSRYVLLKRLNRSGKIKDLNVHEKFVLIDGFNVGKKRFRPITYERDFTYYESGKYIVEDVKGVETAVFKLKRKLFRRRYGFEITVVKNSGGIWRKQ